MVDVKKESVWVTVYNIYTVLASQYLLSIPFITERSRKSGALSALASQDLLSHLNIVARYTR